MWCFDLYNRSLLGAISPTVEFLIMARGLQGVGGTMILVTGMAIITSAFPPRERGNVIGINITFFIWVLLSVHFLGSNVNCFRKIIRQVRPL